MSTTNEKLLSIRDLSVEYTSDNQKVHAVNGVSLELDKGRTLGLVGETGAGKTTIAKTILGILPDVAAKVTGGEIFLNGNDLLKTKEKEMLKIRGNQISMIFQDPMTALNPVQTVGFQIEETIRLHNKIGRKESIQKAKEMLEMVGIPGERYAEYPHQFSGGMKQRVVIAIALACTPDLLLADEPTTALDVTIQAQVLEMIGKLKQEHNTAMIMITHDLGVVAETCDDVAIVYAGQILEYGSLEDIFDHPTHPYTIGLFGALPNLEKDVERLDAIPGLPPDPTNLPEGCPFHPRCKFAADRCRSGQVPTTVLSGKHICKCYRAEEAR